MSDFEDRKYVIFDISEIGTINFEEVLETSSDTCRKSVDLTNVVVKWNTDATPPSVESLVTKSAIYNQVEILDILSGTAWSPKLYEEET